MNFETIMKVLTQGHLAHRLEWTIDHFIFLQVPSTIPAAVVPNMTSLPEQVKKEFERRFTSETEFLSIGPDEISYKNQIAKVDECNVITGWSPLVEDIYATDWHVYKFYDVDEDD